MLACLGYTPGSLQVLVHQFRQNPQLDFFPKPAKGRQSSHKTDLVHDRVIALRKENLSICDISRNLAYEGYSLGPVAVAHILKGEGFARLLRGANNERPPKSRLTTADLPDVWQLDLSPQSFRTKFGGLFLFLPMLALIFIDRFLRESGFPGSEMIPSGAALRSLLVLKLFEMARHGHVMSIVLDQGLALIAGLNVIPKRSFLTKYSCRIDPTCYPELMRRWFNAVGRFDLPSDHSFDFDFHTIPFYGEGV